MVSIQHDTTEANGDTGMKKVNAKDKEMLERLKKFLGWLCQQEDFEDAWMEWFTPKETEQIENTFRKLLKKEIDNATE